MTNLFSHNEIPPNCSLLFSLCCFLASCPEAQRTQQICHKFVTYVWYHDKYLRHFPKLCPHTYVAPVLCAWSFWWSRAEPKKHERSWSFLTESRYFTIASRYQAFAVSLNIYSCSTQRLSMRIGHHRGDQVLDAWGTTESFQYHILVWTIWLKCHCCKRPLRTTLSGRQNVFWQALKQQNSEIKYSTVLTYLPLSTPEGISLIPHGLLVWL